MTDLTDPSRYPLVKVRDGQVYADSRHIASYFDKRHANVLRDIRELYCSPEFRRLNF